MRLLDLQALDTRIDQLNHRRRTLPEHAELERLARKAAAARDVLVAAETNESDAAREQRKLEDEVEAVRTRAARDRERLESGRITAPRELTNLQRELESLARRQGSLEDDLLVVMERREELAARVAQLAAERDEVNARITEVERARDEQLAAIDKDLGFVELQRRSLAAELPADLLALYDKLRGQFGGVGAAALRQRRCEGCRMELNPADLQRIATAAPDAVLRCEECRRILVRTRESGI